MGERNVQPQDIFRALRLAKVATCQDPEEDRWRFERGEDCDGVPLTVVLVFHPDGAKIVSIF